MATDVQCCFCGQRLLTEQPSTLTAVVSSAERSLEGDSSVPTQQLWFHADCMAQRLAANVVWDLEVFLD